MKFTYFFQGLLFGFAYVAPIGLQNLYIIDTAINKDKFTAFKTALITIFFDISLALACFFGVGMILKNFVILKNIIMLLGCIFIIHMAISLMKSIPSDLEQTETNESIIKNILRCFVVTWLNPQAIIDGTILLGGIRASLSDNVSNFFIIGTAAASFIWFNSLTAIICINRTRFKKKILRVINLVCGFIILLYGLKLGYDLIVQFIR